MDKDFSIELLEVFVSVVKNDCILDNEGLHVFYYDSCQGPIFGQGAMNQAVQTGFKGTNTMPFGIAFLEWSKTA